MTDLDRAERWNGRLDRLDTGIPADKVLSPLIVGVNRSVVLSLLYLFMSSIGSSLTI
jgi:hypothetical protein